MKTRTFVAFAVGAALGFVVASASGIHFGDPSASDERKRCADLLARRAERLRQMGDEETAKTRKRIIDHHGKDLLGPECYPYWKTIDVLDNLREGIESGATAP